MTPNTASRSPTTTLCWNACFSRSTRRASLGAYADAARIVPQAYHRFAVAKVGRYGKRDIARLLADPGVVRNRHKIEAAIANARKIEEFAAKHGSFANWIADQHPLSKPERVKLFRKTFRFSGTEIVGEFLVRIGYLPGAHRETCLV